jgi:hypothetical protein
MLISSKNRAQKFIVELIIVAALLINIFIGWLSLYGLPFANIRDKDRPYDIPHPRISGLWWKVFMRTEG